MSLHLGSPLAGTAAYPPGPEEFTGCIARVRDGDQAAARELVARLHPLVHRVVSAHRVRRTPREDLMQETFIKLFARLDQYEGKVPITHWVARIARRTCLDHLRAQRARPEFRRADLEEGESEILDRTLVAPDRGSADIMAKRELIETLFARLPAADQRILRLFVLEEKTFAEIGRLTGWSNGTIKIRTFRARKKLHRLFRELEALEQQLLVALDSRPRATRGRKT
jgi:RNA polymerase sigma factor (sigma-70 family)